MTMIMLIIFFMNEVDDEAIALPIDEGRVFTRNEEVLDEEEEEEERAVKER